MTSSQTLDSYITTSRGIPEPISNSQEIRDKGSIFIAAIYGANSVNSAKTTLKHHKNVVHGSNKATHEISAWRVMTLKPGRDGLGGPDDFELSSGYDDDGENYAAKKVLRVMESERILDAVVVVSRWYGGNLLGPIRFTHIETCAREVCRTFKAIEEVEEHIATLKDLDSQLYINRNELATFNSPKIGDEEGLASRENSGVTPGQGKTQDYSTLLNPPDLSRAKRLVNARKNALRSVQSVLDRLRQNIHGQGSDTSPSHDYTAQL